MIYELILTGKFKKSLKQARKRGLDVDTRSHADLLNM